jgi:hypothetical protein
VFRAGRSAPGRSARQPKEPSLPTPVTTIPEPILLEMLTTYATGTVSIRELVAAYGGLYSYHRIRSDFAHRQVQPTRRRRADTRAAAIGRSAEQVIAKLRAKLTKKRPGETTRPSQPGPSLALTRRLTWDIRIAPGWEPCSPAELRTEDAQGRRITGVYPMAIAQGRQVCYPNTNRPQPAYESQ